MNVRPSPTTVSVLAYISVAIAISAQAGMAIWWAGVVDYRLIVVEREVTDLRSALPSAAARIDEAIRKIAVIEERFVRIETDIRRIADNLQRRPGVSP